MKEFSKVTSAKSGASEGGKLLHARSHSSGDGGPNNPQLNSFHSNVSIHDCVYIDSIEGTKLTAGSNRQKEPELKTSSKNNNDAGPHIEDSRQSTVLIMQEDIGKALEQSSVITVDEKVSMSKDAVTELIKGDDSVMGGH